MIDIPLQDCSIARTLDVVGEKWTLLILRDIWFGHTKFGELEESLGAPRNLLSKRLKKLEENGILRKQEYKEDGARARFEYVLTDSGSELLPVLAALQHWGDKHNPAEGGPRIALTHPDADGKLELVWASNGKILDKERIAARQVR